MSTRTVHDIIISLSYRFKKQLRALGLVIFVLFTSSCASIFSFTSLAGTAVGGGVGVGTGATVAAADSDIDESKAITAFGVGGAVLGLLAGTAIDYFYVKGHGRKEILIVERRPIPLDIREIELQKVSREIEKSSIEQHRSMESWEEKYPLNAEDYYQMD